MRPVARTRRAWRMGFAGAVTGVVLCAGLARGQDSPDQIEDLAGRAVARAALLDLKLAGSPQDVDYRVARSLLEIAHRLSPKESEILRLLIEAETAAGSGERVMELTRTLVAADPGDTVAQLRLITGRITAQQDSDGRLALYNRFLGLDGEKLDASIRSRLALDAALLERERGDLARFAERLSLAVELDPTNKDAVTLALAFYSERRDDPVGRIDLMLDLLYADPFDTQVYRAVARHLAEQGAFNAADRFLNLLDRLYVAQGGGPDVDEVSFREVVAWNRLGAASIVRSLTDELDELRKQALSQPEGGEKGAAAGDGAARSSVRLPISSERTRLLAATALGDNDTARESMSELAASARRVAEGLLDPARRPEGMSEADARTQVQGVLAEVVWLRLLSGQQIEEAATGLEVIRKDPAADAGMIARLDGWLALREGQTQRAAELLAPLADTDPLAALGVAMLLERSNERRAAAARYMDLAVRFAGESLGALARTRVQKITGTDVQRSAAASELEAIGAAVPDWLETIVSTPGRVVALDVQPVRTDVRTMERTQLRVTITNLTAIPMGLGPDRPLSSRLMLVPTADVQGRPMAGGELIEVVSLDRRLRLLPRESVEATVWGDAGSLGLLLDLSSSTPSRVRWRVLQGFRFAPSGVYEQGPHSVVIDTSIVTRRPNPRFLMEPTALRQTIEEGGAREVAEAILAIRGRQARAVERPVFSPEAIDMLMESAAQRFAVADAPLRTLMLAVLPSPVVMPASRRIDEQWLGETNPDVLAMALALRSPEPTSPAFGLAQVRESESLSTLASALRARLEAGRITLANTASDARAPLAPAVGPPVPEVQDEQQSP